MNLSESSYQQACQVLVGGVNSPVRSFNGVGGVPLFMKRGQGPYLYDLDGRQYIDFVLSWGPLILGHCPEDVQTAIIEACQKGWTFGAPVEEEVALAQEILSRHPEFEKIRFVSSGTEATLSALRLARGVTGRDLVVKFAGCYHGHVDSLLVAAGSGLLTLGAPTSAGIPQAIAQTTLVLPYNDPEALKTCFEQYGSQIAAVIVEPVAGNMGVIPPDPEFVDQLNHLPGHHGALLILDEVMTGFRVGYQSAQGRYHYQPDLITFGKVIGGGFPVGAYSGRNDLMNHLSPIGSVYQAGTLSGNPVAMTAGLATLKKLTPEIYNAFESQGQQFVKALNHLFTKYSLDHTIYHVGSLIGIFFCKGPVKDFESAQKTDQKFYKAFFHACLQEGVYLPPSPFEAFFLSTAHDQKILNDALTAIEKALQTII